MHTVRVWDAPTRAFHWLLAGSVIGMVVTAKLGGNWMEWHIRLGPGVLALLVFRLAWGCVGGHWSRFSSFFYGPLSVMQYLKGQAPVHQQVGHSPLGALSVFALLGVLLLQVATGLVSDDEIAFFGPLARFVDGSTVSQATAFHKDIGQWLVLGLVGLHLVAIGVYQFIKKQNLIGPMVHGDKSVPDVVPASLDGAPQRLLALVLAALCAGGAYLLHGLGSA
jgi:cytochrome b